MSLDIDDLLRLIAKAEKKREEARAWDMWLAQYPHMTKKTYVPFSQFLRQPLGPVSTPRPAADLLKEAEQIRQKVRSQQEATDRGDI